MAVRRWVRFPELLVSVVSACVLVQLYSWSRQTLEHIFLVNTTILSEGETEMSPERIQTLDKWNTTLPGMIDIDVKPTAVERIRGTNSEHKVSREYIGADHHREFSKEDDVNSFENPDAAQNREKYDNAEDNALSYGNVDKAAELENVNQIQILEGAETTENAERIYKPRITQNVEGQPNANTVKQCAVPRIPSLVHLVWMARKQNESMQFHHFISFLSVMKRIQPSQIRFYYDNLPIGQYWDEILNLVNKTSTATLLLIKTENPRFIGGKEIKVNEHGSDVVRLDMIRQYGGIYLDLDVIIIRDLTSLMCYDMVLGEENPGNFPNAFMMAIPNSTFANIWWRTYLTDYRDHLWGYNSVEVPAKLAEQYPQFVHVEHKLLMHPNWTREELVYLYSENHVYNWKANYVIHLWYRMYGKYHDPKTIRTLNTTMGQIFRELYYGTTDMLD